MTTNDAPAVEQLTARVQINETRARELLDAAQAEARPLSEVERREFDSCSAAITATEARITELRDAAVQRAEIDQRMAPYGTPFGAPAYVTSRRDDEVRSFIAGETTTLNVDLGPALETRDVLKSGTGANIAPTGFRAELVEAMLQSAVVAQYATRFTTDGGVGNFIVPAATAHATAALTAEAASISESDPTFAQVAFGAYKYAVLTQASAETLDDSGVDLESYLARRCGEAVGRALGAHLVTGTGSSQPTGVVVGSTLGVTAASATTVTMDELINLLHSVGPQYRNSPGTAWLMADSTAAIVRKLKDSNGAYLWEQSTQAGQPSHLLGYPVLIDPSMPAATTGLKSVVFGDLRAYGVRFAGGVRFERSDDFAFANDLVTFRCVVRADAKYLDSTGAIKHLIQA